MQLHRYNELPETHDREGSLLTYDRHFGARVVRLAARSTGNKLDLAMVRALRKHLQRLELNPSVTIVVLQGDTSNVFSSGTDLERWTSLARGEGMYKGASAEARVMALQHVQEQYKLHHLIATYSKPIVAGMTGKVTGSAWALGQHTPYPYVAPNTEVTFPEVAAGLVPHGGASYYLSRVPDGVGMWAGLTGAPVHGVNAYWMGLSPLFGTTKDVRTTILAEAGDHSADVSCGTQLQTDPIYQKAIATVRMFKDVNAGFEADEEDDLSAEMYDEYFRLKQWYQFWAAGDEEGADAALDGQLEPFGDDVERGEIIDFYRGADARRQLEPSRFGNEREGSYDNEPSAAVAERRARIGAVSAHAAALFKGYLRNGPRTDASLKLGVVRRCFGGGGNDQPVLVVTAQGLTPEEQHARAVAQVTIRAEDEAAAAAGGKAEEPELQKDWVKRLASSDARDPLRPYIVEAVQHGHLCHDKDIADKALHEALAAQAAAGKDGATPVLSATLLSPALPAIPLSALSQLIASAVSEAWPGGQVPDEAITSAAAEVLGDEHPITDALMERDLLAESAVEPESDDFKHLSDAQREQASALSDLVEIAAARITAELHKVDPWSLASPSLVEEVRERYAKIVGAASGRPDPTTIVGPQGFTVPDIPKTVREQPEDMDRDDEWDAANRKYGDERDVPAEILPMNPRMYSDPEGLQDSPSEVDDDFLWPFHQGHWTGVIGSGKEAQPIVPDNAMGLRPAMAADAIGVAVDVLRTDVLRMLNAGLGVLSVQHMYIKPIAEYAVIADNAIEGEAGAREQVSALRSRVLGRPGKLAVKQLMQAYAEVEGPTAGDDLDIDVPGSRAQRATMQVAWPQMQALVSRMRALIFQGMIAASDYKITPEDVQAILANNLDSPGGREAILAKDAATGDVSGARLVRLYVKVVKAATPKPRELARPVEGSAEDGDAAMEDGEGAGGEEDKMALPKALPNVALTDAAKEELKAAATTFTAWEAVVLGRRAGGEWKLGALDSQPARFDKYTLGWTVDKESGFGRLTLHRKDIAAVGLIATRQPSGQPVDDLVAAGSAFSVPAEESGAAEAGEVTSGGPAGTQAEGEEELGPEVSMAADGVDNDVGGIAAALKAAATGQSTAAEAELEALSGDKDEVYTVVPNTLHVAENEEELEELEEAILDSLEGESEVVDEAIAELSKDLPDSEGSPLTAGAGAGAGGGHAPGSPTGDAQAAGRAPGEYTLRDLVMPKHIRDVGEARKALLRIHKAAQVIMPQYITDTEGSDGEGESIEAALAGAEAQRQEGGIQGAAQQAAAPRKEGFSSLGDELDRALDEDDGPAARGGGGMGGGAGGSGELRGTTAESVEEAQIEDIMEDALPDGNLPYRQPTLLEPAATAAAREFAQAWDWDTVRDALTDKSGEGAVKLFALPQTGRTQAAGALVADYFRKEADGRVVPPLPASVDEIMHRLAEEANGRPFGGHRAPKGLAGAAARGDKKYAGFAAAFAKRTLDELKGKPQGALRAAHAVILNASTVSLEQAMHMEYRAMARLLGLGVPAGTALDESANPFSPHNANIDVESLLEPLPAGQELTLEGPGASRTKAKALRKEREEAQAKWEAALEQYLAHGEGGGVFGDMFRRKNFFSPPDQTAEPEDEDEEDEEDLPDEEAAEVLAEATAQLKEDEVQGSVVEEEERDAAFGVEVLGLRTQSHPDIDAALLGATVNTDAMYPDPEDSLFAPTPSEMGDSSVDDLDSYLTPGEGGTMSAYDLMKADRARAQQESEEGDEISRMSEDSLEILSDEMDDIIGNKAQASVLREVLQINSAARRGAEQELQAKLGARLSRSEKAKARALRDIYLGTAKEELPKVADLTPVEQAQYESLTRKLKSKARDAVQPPSWLQ